MIPFSANFFLPRLRRIFIALSVIGLLSGLGMPALAEDVDALAKQANKELRTAEKNMHKGQHQQALEQLTRAGELLDKIKAVNPKHRRLRSLEGKLNRLKKNVEKRLGKLKPSPFKPAKPAKAEASAGEKLPAGVTRRLKSIDKVLKWAERNIADTPSRASEKRRIKEVQDQINSAREIMDEIQKGYGDKIPPGHPEMKAAEDRIAAIESKAKVFAKDLIAAKEQREQAKKQRETASTEWIEKLTPFVDFHGKKRLITGATSNVKNLKKQKGFHEEAVALFAEYKKTDFPAGKTDELKKMEEKLGRSLENFPQAYKQSIAKVFETPEKKADQTIAFLADNQGWRKDPKKKPLPPSKHLLDDLRKSIAVVADLVPADHPKLVALNKKMARIDQEDKEIRRAWMDRTFMTPDRFTGKDIKTIKSKAAELVKKDFSDVKILRITVISSDWKEKDVIEHTDTTKTALQRRITRSVTAQVAGKRGSDVFLYTVYVAKNRRSDNTWSALYGNLHQSADHMLEKNVKLNAP